MKAALALCVLAAPAVAEVECAALGAVLGELYAQTQAFPVDWSYVTAHEEGVCVFLDIEGRALVEGDDVRPFFADQIVMAAELRVSGAGVERLLSGGLPDAMQAEVKGYYVDLARDAEFYRYTNSVQSAFLATDATLEFSWDAATGIVDVSQFEMILGWGQRVALSFMAEGVDGRSIGSLQSSLPLATVRSAELSLEGRGWFEFYALDALGWRLDMMPDPDVWLNERLAALSAGLDAAPETILPEVSQAALVQMLTDVPHPDGALQIVLTAEPGLGMARFGRFALSGPPETMAEVWPALEGVVIEVLYEPEGGQ